jgi:3-hydroxyisobutyrate dehydrogenase-like beta-hydroxyacid dehydrogenase
MTPPIALIGFGEAGSTFARAAGWGGTAWVFDIRTERAAEAEELGVHFADRAADALAGAELVLSLVTADAALHVADDYARYARPGALWCDMNSVAPETKRATAKIVEASGARYVDVAVLAPVEPARMAVPLLLSGPASAAASDALAAAGFTNIRVVGDEVGRASAIKMIRSVMVKGIEALTAEMMLAATRAGVVDEVLSSLDASERAMPWAERANYNLDRMLIHGRRRAAEMYESAETLRSLGVSPLMTDSTVNWQQGLGDLQLANVPDELDAKLLAILGSPAFKGEI